MAHSVTVKFFKVDRREATGLNFSDALRKVDEIMPLAKRERDVGTETIPAIVRLERFSETGPYIEGELIRRQSDDLPPEATDNGLVALDVSSLGMRVAFRYNTQLGVLAMQANNLAVSHRRFAAYLTAINSNATFDLEPVPTADAWQRFREGVPRKLIAKIAAPESLGAIEGAAGSVAGSVQQLADTYNKGAIITLEVSMGRRHGSLLREAVKSTVEKFQELRGKNKGDIRELRVGLSTDEGESDQVDFLDEFLVFRDEFEFPKEIDQHYTLRRNHLDTIFIKNMPYLKKLYEPEK